MSGTNTSSGEKVGPVPSPKPTAGSPSLWPLTTQSHEGKTKPKKAGGKK